MKKLTILFSLMCVFALATFSHGANASSPAEKISVSDIVKSAAKSAVSDIVLSKISDKIVSSTVSKELDASQDEVSISEFAKSASEALKLIKKKDVGALAIASAVLALLLQLMKLKLIQPFIAKNRILTFAITTSVSGFLSVSGAKLAGMGWSEAFISGLITSGGAMAIYSSWRGVFKKE